jgi:glucosamine-phosphate N-acetyltransferase
MSNKYQIRKLEYNDYNKKYLDLINTFTRIPENKTFEEFCKIIDLISLQNSHTYVIEHNNMIISSIKILVEQKLHNNFKCVAHIEDLVTHKDYRKQGLASMLLKYVIDLGRSFNCYKIILSSNPENEEFYIKQNFIKKGTEFTIYI